jgi:hypothetical protein
LRFLDSQGQKSSKYSILYHFNHHFRSHQFKKGDFFLLIKALDKGGGGVPFLGGEMGVATPPPYSYLLQTMGGTINVQNAYANSALPIHAS